MTAKLSTFDDLRERHPSDELAAKQWLEQRIVRAQSGDIFAERIRLTPALAREFLTHNKENRPIRPSKLKQYVEDIENNRWDLNGEPLIFTGQGEMNDGQHRCEAVAQTGIAIDTMIAFGFTRESRRTIDNGAARAPGDHLAVEGYSYATEMASIARFVLAFERSGGTSLKDTNRITATEIVDRAMSDDRIEKAAVFSRGVYAKAKSIAPPSVMGFCWYEFSKIDDDAATRFLRSVITGANLSPDSPAYFIRERLIDLDRKIREHRIVYLFHAWNAFRDGRVIQRLAIKKEDMPKLPRLEEPAPQPASLDRGQVEGAGEIARSMEPA